MDPRRPEARTRLGLLLAVVVAFALSSALTPDAARADDPVDVTVTVMRYVEIENPDPLSGPGDYYAAVCWPQEKTGLPDCPVQNTNVGPLQATTNVFKDNTPDVSPYWTLSHTFDRSQGTSVTFSLLVWDFDPGVFQSGDDVMDINPDDNSVMLTFVLDLNTGSWTEAGGAIPPNMGFAKGDGDTGLGFWGPGGEAGKILFDISLSDDGDGDDDGIPDGVERTGVRDENGNLVANLAALGADPCRKTVATEIDFMESQGAGHTHRPQQAALTELSQAYAAAPVPVRSSCPYAAAGFPSGTGVNLVVDVDDPIPEQAAFATSQSVACGKSIDDIRKSFFDEARRPYFHYSVWVHDLVAKDSTSGLQCGGKPDFIVSLGSWPNNVGTARQQAATFMHELGHSLGLGHGGNDSINYKPNYLSVMNYAFSGGIFEQSGGSRIDYSRQALPTLTESALDETAGIADGNDWTRFFDPSDTARFGRANAAIDWNWSTAGNGPFQSSVAADVNGDTTCIRFGANGLSDTKVGGDDVVAGKSIRVGPNGVCDSTANSSPNTAGTVADDTVITAPAFPCVTAGADGVLQTTGSASDQLRSSLAGQFLAYGSNLVCDTTAKAGTDDVQATPAGQSVPSVPLTGFDDWSSLQYASGLGQVGVPFENELHADVTYEEAHEVERFWQDALTPPTASLTVPTSLTGSVVATFSEDVQGVTDKSVLLRTAGTTTPLPAELACRDGGGSTVDCSSAQVRSAVLTPTQDLVPGQYYEALVAPQGAPSITDAPGNAVAAVSAPFRGSLLEDETSVAARYRWQQVTDPLALGGSYMTEHLKGASATFKFQGSSVTWYTITGPDQGRADVYVDGVYQQTVDQYAPVASYQVPLSVGGLAWDAHTLTVKVTGKTSGPAGAGTFVSIDGARVGDTKLLTSPSFRFAWQPNSAFEDVAGVRYVRADLPGADVSFTFRGTGVTWYTVRGPNQGVAEVYVDGVLVGKVNNYAAAQTLGVPVKFSGLADDLHTLRFVVSATTGPGPGFVAVDGWRVA